MSDSNFIQQLAKKLREIGAVHALGEQWISCDGTIPAGGVPFCGQTVQRSLYADLFAWAQAQGRVKTESEWQELASAQGGNCAFYSDGDGSTTFRMPAVLSYLRGSASAGAAGTFVEEGLPNIEGGFRTSNGSMSNGGTEPSDVSGVFTAVDPFTGNTYQDAQGNAWKRYRIGFDASLHNPIYGNSEHVTPRTSCVLVGVYAVSVLTNTSSADVAQIQTALAALESEVGALPSPTAYVTQTWTADDGLSWYRKYSDGWIEQGGKTENVTNVGITVTMPLAFSSTNYRVLATVESTVPTNEDAITINQTSETTFFVWGRTYGAGNLNKPITWMACGN